MNEGKTDLARSIVESSLSNPRQRKELLANFDWHIAVQAADRGNIDEALGMASRMSAREQKVNLLIQLAATALAEEKKKAALQILGIAREQVAGRAENYSQLLLQLQVAQSYTSLDPSASLDIIEPIIHQINEHMVAAKVLEGFEITQYFRDGELIVDSGSGLMNALQQCSTGLGQLAGSNYERTSFLADNFRVGEARIFVRLGIIRGVLNDENPMPHSVSRPIIMPRTLYGRRTFGH